ncbi:MAG: tagaturonate reductase [Clostridia bacterium]|nr:tagaturonate reductase [Clostridia bacterium]
MLQINENAIHKCKRPIKVLQFGEGCFLRAFVDHMIDIANEKGAFDGNIVMVKPRETGNVDLFKKQDSLYTVILRGVENGEVIDTHRTVTAVEKTLHCKADYEEYIALAELDTLEFIVSNTTEAGIVLDVTDKMDGLPKTYPGKLTQFLYKRWEHFSGAIDKGLIILPVELIEDNGKKLLQYVLKLADVWQLPEGFKNWVKDSCVFCNTLVDRIVTGYPENDDEALWQQLGFKDDLLDVGEPFALWVIESERDISDRLPFDKIGLPVVFCNDLMPYRECKVRVLNGAHTSSVLIGYLAGFDIVRDCVNDEIVGEFVRKTVMEEIVPLVPLNDAEVKAFAASVFERFRNPFIDHSLLAISLNSVSKWKARVLPTFKDHYEKYGTVPKKLTFSFAALLVFYRSTDRREDGLYAKRKDGTEYVVHDGDEVLDFISQQSGKTTAEYVRSVADNIDFWGESLTRYNGFCDAVTDWVREIENDPKMALRKVLE